MGGGNYQYIKIWIMGKIFKNNIDKWENVCLNMSQVDKSKTLTEKSSPVHGVKWAADSVNAEIRTVWRTLPSRNPKSLKSLSLVGAPYSMRYISVRLSGRKGLPLKKAVN